MKIDESRQSLVSGLQTTRLRVSDTMPDHVNYPAVFVWGPTGRTLDTQDGQITRNWEVHLLVASMQQSRARNQRDLDQYIEEEGDRSVVAAIESAGPFVVTSWGDYGASAIEGETAASFGITFNVEELA